MIRVAPVPLYNSFDDVFRFAEILKDCLGNWTPRTQRSQRNKTISASFVNSAAKFFMSKVIVIGAGLAGSLLAIYLAKRGHRGRGIRGSRRYASRQRSRPAVRSILHFRIAASRRLREVGMDEYMLAEAVPMYGRMIHSRERRNQSSCPTPAAKANT